MKTFYNFFWRSLQIFGKHGVVFFIFFASSKLLTPYDFGTYNFLLTVIYFLIIFSDFGISQSLSYYISSNKDIKGKNTNKALWSSLITVLVLGILSILLLYIIGVLVLNNITIEYFMLLSPLIILIPISSLLDGAYRGFEKFKILSIINTITGLFISILIFPLIIKYGISGALFIHIIYYGLLTIILFVFYNDIKYNIDYKIIKNIFSYGFFIGLSTVGYFLYTKMDILILGYYGYIEEIAIYEIINKILLLIILPINILGTVIAPKNSLLKSRGKDKEITKNIYKEITILFILGLILYFILYNYGKVIFAYMFSEYNQIVIFSLFSILIFILPFRFMGTYLNIGYITACGYVKILTYSTILYGLINLILNFILLERYGFIGVIYATIITQILFILTNILFYYLKIKNVKTR